MTEQAGSELLDYHQLALSFLGIPSETIIDEESLKHMFLDKLTKIKETQEKLKEVFGSDDSDVFKTTITKTTKLQVQFELSANENKLLSEEIIKKNERIKEQETKIAELAEAKKQIAQMKTALQEVPKLKVQLIQAGKRIEDCEFDLKKTQKKLNLYHQENKSLLATRASLQAEREKNQTKIKTLQTQLAQKIKKIEENKKAIVGLENDIAEKGAELKNKDQKIDQLDKIITELKFTLAQKEEKLSKLEERKNKEIKSLNQQILLLNRQMQTLKITNDTQIHNLQQQIQKLRAQSKKTIEDLSSSHSRKLKELTEDYDTKDRKARDSRIKQLAQANLRAQKNQKALNQRFKRQTDDLIEDFEKRLKDNSSAYTKISKQKLKLQEQFKYQKGVLEKDIENLTTKIAQTQAIIVEKNSIIVTNQTVIQNLKASIKDLNQSMIKSNEESNQQIYYLHEEVAQVKAKIQQNAARDKKLLEDTVKELIAQHKIVLDSIQGVMMEERETQMNELKLKYVDLQRRSEAIQAQLRYQLKQLNAKYNGLKEVYDKKHEQQVKKNKQFVISLNERHKYELDVQAELKQREKTQIKHKYEMQIKAMEEAFSSERAQINSHFVQQKSSALTKLKNAHQGELQLIKRDFTLQLKQKANQFERKIKSVQKKVVDEQNIVKNLTKQLEKIKAESKLKLESMTELHYRNEQQYAKIKEQLQQLQIQKQQQRQEFQRVILRLETDIVQVREQCKKKQQYILDSCKKKIAVNLAEMKTFADNLKQQMHNLQEKHNYRLELLNRQYEELQYLYQQRTSKPEDIEALKFMHRAYIEKELQLQREKEAVIDLKRQIVNKEAAQKLFSSRQLDSVMKVTADAPFNRKK